MLKWINRLIRGEMALGFYLSSLYWIVVLGWITSFAPTEEQKKECYEAAQKAGRKYEECKTFWEKTTSDPVAMFTLVLAFSTVGLWAATIGLYRAGERQLKLVKDNANQQSSDTQATIALARAEFLSTHRPRMRLKHAWFTDQTALAA
jgi:hypothetical protein